MIERELQTYSFTREELQELALFFRKMNMIPEILTEFQDFVQKHIYDSMTIVEAEHLFSEE